MWEAIRPPPPKHAYTPPPPPTGLIQAIYDFINCSSMKITRI